jgi:hypothetical protein
MNPSSLNVARGASDGGRVRSARINSLPRPISVVPGFQTWLKQRTFAIISGRFEADVIDQGERNLNRFTVSP